MAYEIIPEGMPPLKQMGEDIDLKLGVKMRLNGSFLQNKKLWGIPEELALLPVQQ